MGLKHILSVLLNRDLTHTDGPVPVVPLSPGAPAPPRRPRDQAMPDEPPSMEDIQNRLANEEGLDSSDVFDLERMQVQGYRPRVSRDEESGGVVFRIRKPGVAQWILFPGIISSIAFGFALHFGSGPLLRDLKEEVRRRAG